ncbi:MAG TPA: hypothetical protein VFN85_05290, partial [Solirubrobacterales bacterium]|nr:hypothetical protein [Solirubrobacterales bacterium]
MTKRRMAGSGRFVALAVAMAAIFGATASSAMATVAWRVTSVSNTVVAPEGQLTYHLELTDVGDDATDGSEVKLTATLPSGLRGVSANTGSSGFECPAVAGENVIVCSGAPSMGSDAFVTIAITVEVEPSAPETLTTFFAVEGGGTGAEAGTTLDPVRVSTIQPGFGIDAFESSILGADGTPSTNAATHSTLQTTDIDINTHTDPNPFVGDAWPVEDLRDATVSLPPGLVGNPSRFSQCSAAQLAEGEFDPKPLCPAGSQVGVVIVRHTEGAFGSVPLYNMVPPPDAPARFAFNVNGTIISLDAHLRSSGDYGIDVTASGIPQALAIVGNSVSFWGVPDDPRHDPDRGCPGEVSPYLGGNPCSSERPPAAFFRTPTDCVGPGQVSTGLRIDSWQHPGVFAESSAPLHSGPRYPHARSEWGPPVGIEGCNRVPFEPTVRIDATSHRAG